MLSGKAFQSLIERMAKNHERDKQEDCGLIVIVASSQ